MNLTKISHLTAVVVVLLCSQALSRATTLAIDLEGLTDSTILTGQYSGLIFSNSIVYSAGITLNEFAFPPHSGSNVASDSGGPITISFLDPVTTFSGYFTYAEPLTITAYGANSNLLAIVSSVFSNNEAISGDFGSSPNEFLYISNPDGIISLVLEANPNGGSFVIDDITYINTAAPEPASGLAAFAAILILILYLNPPMFRRLISGRCVTLLATLLILCGGAVALKARPKPSPAPTSLTALSVMPSVIPANAAIPITFEVTISDPSLIPESVNLLQVSATGASTVIGQMHDDGMSGDAVAGDRIFTFIHTFVTPANQLEFQVSAAFTGSLRRIFSSNSFVLAISQPPGFTLNAASSSLGGSLSFNNFDNAYIQGGILPLNGAEIDIINMSVPQSFSAFLAAELQGSIITSEGTALVSGKTCTDVTFTDIYTPTLTYANEALYCPSNSQLYKFYLTYGATDSSAAIYRAAFLALLNTTVLKH